MRLYHFTCLLHLPGILSEGITIGEVPIMPNTKLSAPNLTRNGERSALSWPRGSAFDKRKVRLTVSVPDSDEKLKRWRDVCKKYKVKSRWAKIIDTYNEGHNWLFYFGEISTEWIDCVEIYKKSQYEEVDGKELGVLVADINKEKEKLIVRTNGRGVREFRVKEFEDCWLIDGTWEFNPQ